MKQQHIAYADAVSTFTGRSHGTEKAYRSLLKKHDWKVENPPDVQPVSGSKFHVFKAVSNRRPG